MTTIETILVCAIAALVLAFLVVFARLRSISAELGEKANDCELKRTEARTWENMGNIDRLAEALGYIYDEVPKERRFVKKSLK